MRKIKTLIILDWMNIDGVSLHRYNINYTSDPWKEDGAKYYWYIDLGQFSNSHAWDKEWE